MWAPAIEASGVRRPARVYDLRSTFASNAIAAGISLFELAKVMGTSVAMIERHYGSLLDGANAGIHPGWLRSRPSRSTPLVPSALTVWATSGPLCTSPMAFPISGNVW